MMTDTERAITFFENALDNCVMVARKPFETALDALRRVAEDDKAREEGLLVRMPCKRGDTVYFIKSAFSMAKFPIDAKVVSICGINCDREVMYSAVTNYNKLDRKFTSNDLGKTVFLTRQAAEAALGGGEGEG